jgi:hypothetical protein
MIFLSVERSGHVQEFNGMFLQSSCSLQEHLLLQRQTLAGTCRCVNGNMPSWEHAIVFVQGSLRSYRVRWPKLSCHLPPFPPGLI